MNYSEALSFTFQDKEWLKKTAIGGFFAMISFYGGLVFIFGFFLMGYYVGIIRNVMKGEETALPDWSNMSKIFVDGLLGSIITLIYFVVIGGICALIITRVAMDPYIEEYEVVLSCIATSLLTLFALGLFINFGLIQFAATENFGAAFSLSGIFALIKKDLGNFLAILIFSFILNGILFLAGLGILSPFTNFWGMIVQAHLMGQFARNLQGIQQAVAPTA
ncbi:MAG: DUF4013 domain-containing protein [bacterium]